MIERLTVWRTLRAVTVGLGIAGALLVLAVPRFPHRCGGPGALETAAVSTLRKIRTAQEQFAAAVAVDLNGNGVGEFGTFAEMSSGCSLRGHQVKPSLSKSVNDLDSKIESEFDAQLTDAPECRVTASRHIAGALDPPLLSRAFQRESDEGVVSRSGYCFRIDRSEAVVAVHRAVPTTNCFRDAENLAGDGSWAAYAWPAEPLPGARRVFYACSCGDLFATVPETAVPVTGPDPRAAHPTSIEVPGEYVGRDGNTWRQIN